MRIFGLSIEMFFQTIIETLLLFLIFKIHQEIMQINRRLYVLEERTALVNHAFWQTQERQVNDDEINLTQSLNS